MRPMAAIPESTRNSITLRLLDHVEAHWPQGRSSKSLTLERAVAVITAAATLPVMELRPGLKDVRRPGRAMHALPKSVLIWPEPVPGCWTCWRAEGPRRLHN